MNDKEFIKLYKNLKSISSICDELGIDKGNVSRETISDEQAKKLADELKFEIVKIYSKQGRNSPLIRTTFRLRTFMPPYG